jgi:ribokinase
MKIVVVGSSNIDMVAQVDHLPAPGETVGNARFIQVNGGKGANQAVAAARLGGEVTFITSLGNDLFSKALIEHFKNEKIVTDYILIDPNLPTGTALIFVASNAENCIAVAPGANSALLPSRIGFLESVISNADIVVMQAEIPYETICHVAFLAHRKGVKVLLNPAPACSLDSDLLQNVDILVVNETEAEIISGKSLEKHTIETIALTLFNLGVKNVVITLGKQGVYLKTRDYCCEVPAFKVTAVDTTAAGDTFCGALAVACTNGKLNEEALQFASAAAAISVTSMGAQSSIPKLEEVVNFLKINQ